MTQHQPHSNFHLRGTINIINGATSLYYWSWLLAHTFPRSRAKPMQEAMRCLGQGETFNYLNKAVIFFCLLTYKLKASEWGYLSHPCRCTMRISCHVPFCAWRLGCLSLVAAAQDGVPWTSSLSSSLQEATKQYTLLPSLLWRKLITGNAG